MSSDNENIITITHSASGATCKVHKHGATVISFVSSDGREHLFLSKLAKLDGSKAIRGGIPLVFPFFGPPMETSCKTMPQHGFARINTWKLESTYDDSEAAGATLTLDLKDVVQGRGESGTWATKQTEIDKTDCMLTYEIRLEAKQLTTTMIAKNTGESAFPFHLLQHTYLAVDGGAAHDNSKTYVSGLGGYAITDKVSGDSGHVQSYDDPVVVKGETDHVYIHPEGHPTVHAKVATGAGAIVGLEAAGQVAEQVSPVSCVVWNPAEAKAKSMSDFADEQYHDMICVEPGLIGHQPLLHPGKEARLTQSIIAP